MVRETIDPRNKTSTVRDGQSYVAVDFFKICNRNFTRRDTALVRHNNDFKSKSVQTSDRFQRIGKELHFTRLRDVFALGSFSNDHAVTIKKYSGHLQISLR